MNKEEIFEKIDHTALKPFTTWEQVDALCQEAIEYKMASVCVPPCYVKKIKETYGDTVNICTVIGFPLGYNTMDVKVFEAEKAIEEGADEIDMVINVAALKNHHYKYVEEEMAAIRKISQGKVFKVIVETCYLEEEEKIKLCEMITRTGADYIKTSTGFGTGGATLEDIRLFKKYIGKNVKMKASGGIRTSEAMQMYIEEGCSRIGTSSATKLIR